MQRRFTLLAAAALAVGSMGWVADTWAQDTAQNAADRTKAATDNAADATKDAAGNAADATKDAADTTADATKNAADKTADATKDAADSTKDAAGTAADKTSDAARNTADATKDAAGTAADKTSDAAGKTADATKDTGSKTGGLGAEFTTLGNIRDTLANGTEAALTKGGFDDLVERFVDADRNRIGKGGFSEQEMPEIDGKVAQLQADWKAKYNQDFKIKDQAAVYSDQFAKVEVGEFGSNAKLAADQQKNSQEPTAKSDDNAAGNDQKDQNLEKGRNIATVTIAASHDMPELTIPLIQEAPLGKWKINVPDTVDGPKLKANLLKHLSMVADMKDKWPADVNEAYRAVSHHVLAAVLDADSEQAADKATGASGTIQTLPPAVP